VRAFYKKNLVCYSVLRRGQVHLEHTRREQARAAEAAAEAAAHRRFHFPSGGSDATPAAAPAAAASAALPWRCGVCARLNDASIFKYYIRETYPRPPAHILDYARHATDTRSCNNNTNE
jgi:hypothetical protein